jgi:hypothetical protein
MRRATDVSSICREIVMKTAVQIQGRKFVRVEGWQSIATAHGCFAGAEDAERAYDNQGNHIGYKAQGVLRNAHGEVIATGEGYVGFDEKDRKGNPTWKNRDEYAGRAMAQTRAISRTCRGVFAHVVVLIDAGLSTTPAEEVPDGGFDDDQRAARAKTVSSPTGTGTGKRDGAKAPSAALPEPTEAQRLKWIAMLLPLGQAALLYCYEKQWLVGPNGVNPGEPLEVLGLEHVPRTKRQADAILFEIQARMDSEATRRQEAEMDATEPPGGWQGATAGSPDTAETPSDAGKGQTRSNAGHSEAEPNQDVETVTCKLEQVSEQSGKSKKGPWTRYGIRSGEVWFSTFSKPLGELAKKDKGHTVRIQFRRGERGNDMVSIERA